MKVIERLEEANEAPPSAVTIGKFAGVHLGHQAVLRQLCDLADAEGLTSVVVTFDRHPAHVVAPDRVPEPLTSNADRVNIFERAGVDLTLMIPFDSESAKESASDFVRRVLVEGLNAKVVLVGNDFRFGAHGAGNVALLRELGEQYGFRVAIINEVLSEQGQRISSSAVRRALKIGNIPLAAVLLGRYPEVTGLVVHGHQRGRDLGFPTANLGAGRDPVSGERVELTGFVPGAGVYAGWLKFQFDGDWVTRAAAISVGTNPTFDGNQITVEAYVIGEQDLDLYDQQVRVLFGLKLREMLAFDSLDELVTTMGNDVRRAAQFCAEHPLADA